MITWSARTDERDRYLRTRNKGLAIYQRAYEIYRQTRSREESSSDSRIRFSYSLHHDDGAVSDGQKYIDQATAEFDAQFPDYDRITAACASKNIGFGFGYGDDDDWDPRG